jgi:hypothetical protein
MSEYGVIGYHIEIAVVVQKTIYVGGFDEEGAIEEALNEFNITKDDWKNSDLEVIEVRPDFFDI